MTQLATWGALVPVVGFSVFGAPFLRIALTRYLARPLQIMLWGLFLFTALTGGVLSALMAQSVAGGGWFVAMALGAVALLGGLVANSPWGFSVIGSPMSPSEVLREVGRVRTTKTDGCELAQIRGMAAVNKALAAAREEFTQDGMQLMEHMRASYVPVGDAEAMFAAVWTARRTDGFILRSLGRGLEAWGLAPHQAVGGYVSDWPDTGRFMFAVDRFASGDLRPFVAVNNNAVTTYAPRPRGSGDLVVAVSIPLLGCEVFDYRD